MRTSIYLQAFAFTIVIGVTCLRLYSQSYIPVISPTVVIKPSDSKKNSDFFIAPVPRPSAKRK